MKRPNTWILLVMLVCCRPGVVPAQLQLLPGKEPQQVFAGTVRKIAVIWHNAGNQVANAEIRTRMFQTTSATAVELGEAPWKHLQVLPQQTVVESVSLDFPAITSETKFLIQWMGESNRVLGISNVQVYPTNLLEELRGLAGDKAIGIFDPQNLLKPLLKNLKIGFEDVGDFSLTNFSGRLAIIGPFRSASQTPDDLPKQIKVLGKKDVAVVWIQSPGKNKGLQPSFYAVPEKKVAIMIVQPELVSDLVEDPQSQLNLICLCKLALNPQPPDWPNLAAQP